jgi:hypothetical protein
VLKIGYWNAFLVTQSPGYLDYMKSAWKKLEGVAYGSSQGWVKCIYQIALLSVLKDSQGRMTGDARYLKNLKFHIPRGMCPQALHPLVSYVFRLLEEGNIDIDGKVLDQTTDQLIHEAERLLTGLDTLATNDNYETLEGSSEDRTEGYKRLDQLKGHRG